MPTDSGTAEPDGQYHLDDESREVVVGVHSLPCTTSTMNDDASSFGPIQLSMDFDGEEAADVTDPPTDLQTIYDGQVLSHNFTFQVNLKFQSSAIHNRSIIFMCRKRNYLAQQPMIQQ